MVFRLDNVVYLLCSLESALMLSYCSSPSLVLAIMS